MDSIHQTSTANDGFPITPSDTVDIVGDVANFAGVASVYVHNPSTGGAVKVMPAAKKDFAGLDLSGSSGTANITVAGVAYLATYGTSLSATINAFIITHGRALTERNIKVRHIGTTDIIIFDGVSSANVSIANVSGDLNGAAITKAPITVFIGEGDVFPLAVSRVYASTPTPPVGLIGLYSFGR